MRTRTRAATAAAGLMLLVLAGCSNGDDNDAADDPADDAGTETEDEAMETPEDEAMETPGAEAMTAGTVTVGTTDVGDVLVDAEGMTLYLYEPDAQGESTCYDQCAAAWPPLLVDGDPAAGEGVDAALLGTTERTDGTVQVTYDDWPLYYWAQDAAAGDTTGQAVNDVWWVLDATGEPIRD